MGMCAIGSILIFVSFSLYLLFFSYSLFLSLFVSSLLISLFVLLLLLLIYEWRKWVYDLYTGLFDVLVCEFLSDVKYCYDGYQNYCLKV